VESDIISDIGINFYPISDISMHIDRHNRLVLKRSLTFPRDQGSNLQEEIFFFFNIGDRNEL
jgi:hypothetical protein